MVDSIQSCRLYLVPFMPDTVIEVFLGYFPFFSAELHLGHGEHVNSMNMSHLLHFFHLKVSWL